MAILFRNLDTLTVGGMGTRLTVYSGADSIRVELTPYGGTTAAVYATSLEVGIAYNGEEKTISRTSFTRSESVIFPFVSDVRGITLTCEGGIVYGEGETSVQSLELMWHGDGTLDVPVPSVTYYTGLIKGSPLRLEWKVEGIPEGYRAYTLGIEQNFATKGKVETDFTRSTETSEKTDEFVHEHTISSLEVGNCIFYRIAFGLYPEEGAEEAGRDEYVLYFELDTPIYVCSGNSEKVIAPHSLRASGIRKNRTTTVTWELPDNSLRVAGFCLEYAYEESSWYTLFWNVCPSCSYSFTVPETAKRVAFRIMSYSTRSKYETSAYCYSPWLEAAESNVYVGVSGGTARASGVYIGSAQAAQAVVGGDTPQT